MNFIEINFTCLSQRSVVQTDICIWDELNTAPGQKATGHKATGQHTLLHWEIIFFYNDLTSSVKNNVNRHCILLELNEQSFVTRYKQEAQLLLGDRATRKHAKDC